VTPCQTREGEEHSAAQRRPQRHKGTTCTLDKYTHTHTSSTTKHTPTRPGTILLNTRRNLNPSRGCMTQLPTRDLHTNATKPPSLQVMEVPWATNSVERCTWRNERST
jgi:hypothetical protein